MSEFVKETSDTSFQRDVLSSNQLVLVDFWAPWCVPCKMILPHIDAVAEKFSSQGLAVYKLNVEGNQQVPQQYGVQAIPNLILFKDGEVVATQVGGVNKAVLEKMITPHLEDKG